MVITYEESLDGVYVNFEFEPRHLGILVRVMVVDEREVLVSTLLPIRDACRLAEWLSRWLDQPFSTPEWTLRYVEDDPDLEFVLHRGRTAEKNLSTSPYEVRPASETLGEFLLS